MTYKVHLKRNLLKHYLSCPAACSFFSFFYFNIYLFFAASPPLPPQFIEVEQGGKASVIFIFK